MTKLIAPCAVLIACGGVNTAPDMHVAAVMRDMATAPDLDPPPIIADDMAAPDLSEPPDMTALPDLLPATDFAGCGTTIGGPCCPSATTCAGIHNATSTYCDSNNTCQWCGDPHMVCCPGYVCNGGGGCWIDHNSGATTATCTDSNTCGTIGGSCCGNWPTQTCTHGGTQCIGTPPTWYCTG